MKKIHTVWTTRFFQLFRVFCIHLHSPPEDVLQQLCTLTSKLDSNELRKSGNDRYICSYNLSLLPNISMEISAARFDPTFLSNRVELCERRIAHMVRLYDLSYTSKLSFSCAMRVPELNLACDGKRWATNENCNCCFRPCHQIGQGRRD